MAKRKNQPADSADPRLAQLEQGLGAPLSEEMRAEVLERLRNSDRRLAEVAAKYPLPDQMEPCVMFRPVAPAPRRGSRRDG